MSDHLAPHDTANLLGIKPATLRRWCDYHKEHLSPGVNPAPGQARRFTSRDIEVLKHVRALRVQGLTVASINEQLAGLTFAEIDTPIEATSIALQDEQDSQIQAPAPLVAPDYLIAIERRFEAVEASVKEGQQGLRDNVLMFAAGFIAALLFMLAVIGIAVLYGGFR